MTEPVWCIPYTEESSLQASGLRSPCKSLVIQASCMYIRISTVALNVQHAPPLGPKPHLLQTHIAWPFWKTCEPERVSLLFCLQASLLRHRQAVSEQAYVLQTKCHILDGDAQRHAALPLL